MPTARAEKSALGRSKGGSPDADPFLLKMRTPPFPEEEEEEEEEEEDLKAIRARPEAGSKKRSRGSTVASMPGNALQDSCRTSYVRTGPVSLPV